ncbi:MAG TPA: type II toxin-antitoxin system PemK/MazF family toxin [Tepidisphaeraceae bacterium]|nr:type II toxin-antitoxin system PemK/MazF family toxin [Tepidisphaeraceae bacterium]
MKRGEVWWANLPAPIGRRPVLLLSRDRAYVVRSAVTVAFLTTTIRNIPVEVKLTPADGVPKDCVVNLDTINTIPKSALEQRICALSAGRLTEVRKALQFALDI